MSLHWFHCQRLLFLIPPVIASMIVIFNGVNYSAPIYLITDVNSTKLGAAIFQIFNNTQLIIACADRPLEPTEVNLSPFHREHFSITWALSEFQDIIDGEPVTVITDNISLNSLLD